jgi:hypothetical protein
VVLTAVLDAVVKRKIPSPAGNRTLEPRSLALSRNSPPFMEPENVLPCSQESAISPNGGLFLKHILLLTVSSKNTCVHVETHLTSN